MTERLNVTTATGESAVFSPGGEFTIQVSAAHYGAMFDVMGRVDATADWEIVGTVKANEKFAHFADLPFIKVRLRANLAGSAAKAWSSV